MTIGEALRRFRTEFKLNQETVAEKLELTRQAYSFYEVDKGIPPAHKIVKLAQTYDVSADYLLGLSDEPRPTKYDAQEVKTAFALRDAVRAVVAQ